MAPDHSLILDTISFPAFGAGIPENRGKKTWVDEKGNIFMDEIDQSFPRIDWINSHYATRKIKLNDELITSGRLLPEHTRLILVIEERDSLMEDLKKASTTNPTSASSFSDAPLNKDGVITGDMSEEMMAKTTAIIEKVDKESATRKFTGVMQSFFYIFVSLFRFIIFIRLSLVLL
ncbi:DUF1850 domain-containing protein [Acidaminococcus intestini]|nr:DUF1850 domain-containing protein [Acidaminococcus intestini]